MQIHGVESMFSITDNLGFTFIIDEGSSIKPFCQV